MITMAVPLSPLAQAIEDGNLKHIEALLERGVDIQKRFASHEPGDDGSLHVQRNPLEAAVSAEQLDVVSLLIKRGADVNARGGWATALQEAVLKKNESIARLLLDAGADVNAKRGDEQWRHRSFKSTEAYSLENRRLSRISSEGDYHPRYFRLRHETALVLAVRDSNSSMVRLLFDSGATLYQQSVYDAAETGDVSILRMVLERLPYAGVDINTNRGRFGTPLDVTSIGPNPSTECFLLLLKHGADIFAQKGFFRQPIVTIAAKGKAEMMQVLRNGDWVADARQNLVLQGNLSLLHIAICHRNVEMVYFLVNWFGEPLVNSQDSLGRTPLHLATMNSEEAIKILYDACSIGITHRTTESLPDPSRIVQYLRKRGARGDIPDYGGITALEVALHEFRCNRYPPSKKSSSRRLSGSRPVSHPNTGISGSKQTSRSQIALLVFLASPRHGLTATKWRHLLGEPRKNLELTEDEFMPPSSSKSNKDFYPPWINSKTTMWGETFMDEDVKVKRIL